jgi:hypothetical protein
VVVAVLVDNQTTLNLVELVVLVVAAVLLELDILQVQVVLAQQVKVITALLAL